MQTHADLRIGTLVRWFDGESEDPVDIDDIGLVTRLPGADWDGYYHIAWAVTDTTSYHSPDMIEESLYQGQMEIVG